MYMYLPHMHDTTIAVLAVYELDDPYLHRVQACAVEAAHCALVWSNGVANRNMHL